MKTFIGIILSFVMSAASAAIVAVAPAEGGARLNLWDEQRMCQGTARYANFQVKADTIHGCLVTDGKMVQVVFFDGDTLLLPVQVFKKPEEV